ncbi:uncharacterized protein LOC130440571 [Diorhabda sublineata]|uniref:uncharacterized protein LOC130440571 n=1 Tax=Diorhabda sublineata TaxID=1163346 RepID=UPI0024E142C6|nr:uncharacterized protein LOC130440571 [Diorhabda sublineata]
MKKLTCVVPGCDSGDSPTDNIQFHQIPKESDVRKKWLKAINRTEAEINKKSRVCSKHFKSQDYAITKINYTMGGKAAPSGSKNTCEFKALKSEVVPNLQLPQKSTFKIKISKKDNAKQIKVEEVKVKEEKIEKLEKPEKIKMPKRPAPPDSPPPRSRTQSRRAASKEALKQMQLLLDDENDTVEIPDDVIPIDTSPHVPPPPKKKYKLSHRKSSDGNTIKPAVDREAVVLKTITNRDAENTLELDCWIEPLEEIQINRSKKLQEEEKEIQAKLDSLISQCDAKVIHKGELSTIVEVAEQVQSAIQGAQAPPTSLIINNNLGGQQSYQLVMDPRMGLVVGAVNPTTTSQLPPAPKVYQGKVQVAQNLQQTPTTSSTLTTPRVATRARGRGSTNKITPPPPVVTPTRKAAGNQNVSVTLQTRQANQTRTQATTPTRAQTQVQTTTPTRLQTQATPQTRSQAATPQTRTKVPTVIKKQITVVQTNTPNTRGRGPSPNTFTTQVRPSESNVEGGLTTGSAQGSKKVVVDLTSDDGKSAPDSREISFNKLQGKTYPSLVVVARPHLRVQDLSLDRPKLDAKVKSVLMHAPTKFTEWLIQQGLIRSEQKCSVHTNTQLKLGMYSDVTKFPYSGGYVWISECCPQKFVSVFSGSLFEGSPHPPMVILKLLYHWACQTNIQNVTQWVKVDNLYVKGMFTWLRSTCTVALQTHIRQIGGPGVKVEVGVISLGTTSQDGNQRQVKVEVLGVLESESKLIRLRAVEPQIEGDRNYKKRFSKILEPLIQWVHPQSILVADLTVDKQTLIGMGFSNVVHYSSTQYGNNKQIMDYLRRIVPRMFQNTLSLLSRQIIQQFLDELVWREWFGTSSLQAFDNIVSHLAEQTKYESGSSLIVRLNKVAQNPFKSWNMNLCNPSKTVENAKKSRNARKPDPPKSTQQAPMEVNRPPKSTSPDVPEQMVPLENYYYGTIDTYSKTPKITLNMKCPFCKSVFDNNIQLMSHLFKHAHNVSMDAQLCRYCLTSVATANDLLKHIATSHPAETKFDNGFCCLICETQYMNPFVLGKHMSKEHCPSELPYQCGTCGYRCSNHKQAIDHFYRTHDNGPTIQCPFCLKSTTVFTSSRNIVQNMNYFIQHLQKHQRKQFARRCGKCNLWFVQKDVIKEHQNKMHISQRGKTGLVPWNAPRNGVMVPKSKMDKYPVDAEVINFAALTFDLGKGLLCKECNTPMDTPKHFPSFESCQNPNCQYSTCCTNAMQEHNAKCSKTNNPIAEETLPFEMFCICGFSSLDGNQMARHLAICERKSSYPSKSEAQSAIVTHSMLDVLGLVRKPEESPKPESSKSEYSKPRPRTEKKKKQMQELNALDDASNIPEANKDNDIVMMEEIEDNDLDKNRNDEVDAIAFDESENKQEEEEEAQHLEDKENPIKTIDCLEIEENQDVEMTLDQDKDVEVQENDNESIKNSEETNDIETTTEEPIETIADDTDEKSDNKIDDVDENVKENQEENIKDTQEKNVEENQEENIQTEENIDKIEDNEIDKEQIEDSNEKLEEEEEDKIDKDENDSQTAIEDASDSLRNKYKEDETKDKQDTEDNEDSECKEDNKNEEDEEEEEEIDDRTEEINKETERRKDEENRETEQREDEEIKETEQRDIEETEQGETEETEQGEVEEIEESEQEVEENKETEQGEVEEIKETVQEVEENRETEQEIKETEATDNENEEFVNKENIGHKEDEDNEEIEREESPEMLDEHENLEDNLETREGDECETSRREQYEDSQQIREKDEIYDEEDEEKIEDPHEKLLDDISLDKPVDFPNDETLSDLQNHVLEKTPDKAPTITSDDIQSLLSDVVGESEAMDTESGNKQQLDDVAEEMMDITEDSGDIPTPMDTD